MVWKIFVIAFLFIVGLFVVGIVYQNFPRESVTLKGESIESGDFSTIKYGETPVFLENLRFNHNDISYFIDSSCSDIRRSAMIEAFGLFEGMTKYISFYEVSSDADIDVLCSDNFVMLEENLFAAGEGGPMKIINTSRFKVIEKGRIFLYDDPRCDYPIVEMHELGHVFGFDHSENPVSIMYAVSRCNQKVTDDMIELIDALYEIEPLADVWISNLSAVKRGRFLDFNITVLNEGLVNASDVDLSIIVDGVVDEVLELGYIEIGFGRTLRVKNLRLSSDFDSVEFYVDEKNSIRELNEENNVVEMGIGS